MNSRQALSKAKKLFGPRAVVRENERFTTSQEKAALRANRPSLLAQIKALEEGGERKHALKLCNDLTWKMSAYRCEIGVRGLFGIFVIEGGGDNWVQALQKIRR